LISSNDSCAEWRGKDLLLSVRVHPRASRNEILGIDHGQLRIRTTAAPTDGKANKAVTRLLADYLQVSPSRIVLIRGKTHRNKRFLVSGPINTPESMVIAIRQSP